MDGEPPEISHVEPLSENPRNPASETSNRVDTFKQAALKTRMKLVTETPDYAVTISPYQIRMPGYPRSPEWNQMAVEVVADTVNNFQPTISGNMARLAASTETYFHDGVIGVLRDEDKPSTSLGVNKYSYPYGVRLIEVVGEQDSMVITTELDGQQVTLTSLEVRTVTPEDKKRIFLQSVGHIDKVEDLAEIMDRIPNIDGTTYTPIIHHQSSLEDRERIKTYLDEKLSPELNELTQALAEGNGDIEVFKRKTLEVYWLVSQACFYHGGSSGLANQLLNIYALKAGFTEPIWKKDVDPNLEAILTPKMSDFVRNVPDLIEFGLEQKSNPSE